MNKQQLREIVAQYKETLPESVKTLIDILGFDGLYELSGLYGGSLLYIRKQDSLFTNCLELSMLNEFDGSNHIYLGKKYGFATRTVYRLVDENMRGKQKKY